MSGSSTLLARQVHQALQRIPPSYVRRDDASRGGGAHSNVLQFATEVEASPANVVWDTPDISYVASGDDEGAFLVNRSGVYAVTLVIGRTANSITPAEIRVGTAVDNLASDAKTRARGAPMAVATYDNTLTWIGPVVAGDHIWAYSGADPGTDDENTQITIVKVG